MKDAEELLTYFPTGLMFVILAARLDMMQRCILCPSRRDSFTRTDTFLAPTAVLLIAPERQSNSLMLPARYAAMNRRVNDLNLTLVCRLLVVCRAGPRGDEARRAKAVRTPGTEAVGEERRGDAERHAVFDAAV